MLLGTEENITNISVLLTILFWSDGQCRLYARVSGSQRQRRFLFLLVLHRIVTAAAAVEEFRYRIEGDRVVCYDSLLPEATVGRADHTFSFAAFEYDPDELVFIRRAKAEMERLQATTGLNKGGTFHPNAIHYSAVPWLSFTDMKHPTNMRSGDSVPKISTGKYFREGERLMMPVSVTCHHGLMDGYHVAQFIEKLHL